MSIDLEAKQASDDAVARGELKLVGRMATVDPLDVDPLDNDELEANAAYDADGNLLVSLEDDRAEGLVGEATMPARRAAGGSAIRKNRWAGGLDWPVVLWLSFLHVGALAAPFVFTWKALALALVLSWLTGSIGICLGYHRLLTHGSFQTYRPLRWLMAWLGGLAGEGSALMWVAVHRKHHVHSDQEGDPHSPNDGAWWSHMLWLSPKNEQAHYQRLIHRYAPDLEKDGVMRFLDKTFLLWHFVLGAALFAIGYFGWDAYTGWSFLVYGIFLRLIYVLHVTWFVNSASHIWGYRNYKTTDNSRNLWWVGLLAFGEGWHNNHHAYQRMARHGHRWWEVDVTYWAILAMEKLGLAWGVVHDVRGRKQPK